MVKVKETIKGIVEDKKEDSIKVNDNWYKSNTVTKVFVEKIEKEDLVEFTIDDQNNILYIQCLSKHAVKSVYDIGKKYKEIMEVSKKIVDEVFGGEDKYRDFLGQHVNTLFIAIERMAREKGLL